MTIKTFLLNDFYAAHSSFSFGHNAYSKLNEYLHRKSIQTHLALTEAVLRNKSVSHLSLEQRTKREKNLDKLHEYWKRAQFPRNIENPGQRLPYIRDSFGTLCAMAYLIDESGDHELVDTLFHSNNHIYIKDVNEGPVVEWLNRNGLSKEEAMRIQPTYGGMGGYTPPPPTLWGQLLPWAGLFGGVLIFVVLSHISFIFIHSCNLAGKSKIFTYIYFALINLTIAGLASGFIHAILN
jgi:hypothetical protein